MTITQTITALIAALNGIPAAVTAAKVALTDFEAFLAANL
jgi:hypothetical protein